MVRFLHTSKKGQNYKMFKLANLILFLNLASGSANAQFFDEGYMVRDVRNNIIWLKCTVGQKWNDDQKSCLGEIVKLNQSQIDEATRQASEQLGGSWRLPTLQELESIVCHECEPPKVRNKYFPNLSREAYWTGTRNFFNSKMYWSVNFMTGHRYSRFFAYQQLPVLLVKDR